MALTRWQSTIVDERGNVQPGAVLTIRNESDQSLAQVYESPGDTQPYPLGTVVANASGYAYFYAKGGLYRIQSQDLNIDWRHVALGSAQAADVVQTTGQSEDAVMSQKAATDAFAQLAGGEAADFAAMPMVSGSPIIERGSNANGEYVRFADGTQICTHTAQAVLQNSSNIGVSWRFPADFLDVPSCGMSVNSYNLAVIKALMSGCYGNSTTGVTASLVRLPGAPAFTVQDAETITMRMSSVGRYV